MLRPKSKDYSPAGLTYTSVSTLPSAAWDIWHFLKPRKNMRCRVLGGAESKKWAQQICQAENEEGIDEPTTGCVSLPENFFGTNQDSLDRQCAMGGAASGETLQRRAQDASCASSEDLPVAHQQPVPEASAALEHSEQATGNTSGGDAAAKALAPTVIVTLISGRSCRCDCSTNRTIGELMQEAQQELGVVIKCLIGPTMEPLNEGKTLEEENVLPGNTLTVVVVDQAAEDKKEAAGCGDIIAAVLCGRVGAVRHFLRAWPGGARWWDGRYDLTPLHAAARNGNVEICRVLLAARAQVDAETSNWATPLDYAREKGHDEVVKLLEAALKTEEDITDWLAKFAEKLCHRLAALVPPLFVLQPSTHPLAAVRLRLAHGIGLQPTCLSTLIKLNSERKHMIEN
eukprot:s165_g34.t1